MAPRAGKRPMPGYMGAAPVTEQRIARKRSHEIEKKVFAIRQGSGEGKERGI